MPHHICGYGWSSRSKAFILDQRKHEKVQYLLQCYEFYYPDICDRLQTIPCGQCLECRIKASKELAQRALAETTLHKSNYFITLTYDNEHIGHCYGETVSRTTGEYGFHPNLVKRDFQLFAKNLRQYNAELGNSELVIFYCGEYGPEHGRPHFHAIVYGLELPDLKLFKNENGVSYFTSDIVSNAWRDFEHEGKDARPRGFSLVCDVNWSTCAYVARYVTKKMIGNSENDYQSLCKDFNVEPQQREFHQGPKRPGLGKNWLLENMDDVYEHDKVVLPGGKLLQPCSYFDKLYDIDNHDELLQIKETRRYKNGLRKMRELFGCQDVEAYEKQQQEIRERRLKKFTQRQDL